MWASCQPFFSFTCVIGNSKVTPDTNKYTRFPKKGDDKQRQAVPLAKEGLLVV